MSFNAIRENKILAKTSESTETLTFQYQKVISILQKNQLLINATLTTNITHQVCSLVAI